MKTEATKQENLTGNKTEEAAVVFDKNQPQKMVFTPEDDENHYELEFQLAGLSDEDLAEFDRLSFIKLESQGENQVFTSDDFDACSWFFDKNISLVGGFEGNLPENWRDEFDLQQRQSIVREFMTAYVKGSEKTKFKKSFSFGKSTTAKKVTLIATFNGREIECGHTLPENKSKFLRDFIKITQGLVSKKGKSGTYLPETFRKLGRLYDEMGVAADNYAPDGVPLHHKALVLRETFSAQAEAQRKK